MGPMKTYQQIVEEAAYYGSNMRTYNWHPKPVRFWTEIRIRKNVKIIFFFKIREILFIIKLQIADIFVKNSEFQFSKLIWFLALKFKYL